MRRLKRHRLLGRHPSRAGHSVAASAALEVAMLPPRRQLRAGGGGEEWRRGRQGFLGFLGCAWFLFSCGYCAVGCCSAGEEAGESISLLNRAVLTAKGADLIHALLPGTAKRLIKEARPSRADWARQALIL